jgi:hypothetical protein
LLPALSLSRLARLKSRLKKLLPPTPPPKLLPPTPLLLTLLPPTPLLRLRPTPLLLRLLTLPPLKALLPTLRRRCNLRLTAIESGREGNLAPLFFCPRLTRLIVRLTSRARPLMEAPE